MQKMIVIDIETTGLSSTRDKLKVITVLEDDSISIYRKMTCELRNQLADANIIKIFHNSKFDVSFLEWRGIKVRNVECTWLMAKVLNEPKCSLKELARKYCGIHMNKELQHGDNWKGELTQAHIQYVSQDVEVPYKLYPILKQKLIEQNLWDVYKRENAANAIIPRLNNDGICFDYKGWEGELQKKKHQIEKLSKKLKKAFNDKAINLNSHKQLLEAFRRLGIKLESTEDAQLALHEEEHKAIKWLRMYRRQNIQLKTYGEKLKEKIDDDGRLRGNWSIMGAVSGRMSCSNPPLQAMPAESKPFFRAMKGNKLIIADYSQVELRVLAEIAQDERMLQCFAEKEDLHKLTAALVLNKPSSEVTEDERKMAKGLNFGMVYGITEYGIKRNLAKKHIIVSLEEASNLRVRFLESYPQVQQFQDSLLKSYLIKSLGGRSWLTDEVSLTKRLNYAIQGTAADGFKEALILVNQFLKLDWLICAAVHDEIVLEVPEEDAEEAALLLEKAMIQGMKKFLKQVCIEVDVHIADYWQK